MMGDALIFCASAEPGVPGIGWHRDRPTGGVGPDGKTPDSSEAAERRRWRAFEQAHAAHVAGRPRMVIAWHLALVDDCSLECVPGSHYKYRTAAELAAMRNKEIRT
eukprot:SAG22_NODE_3271_length_1817_cov_1.389988_1_plen_105_part_10